MMNLMMSNADYKLMLHRLHNNLALRAFTLEYIFNRLTPSFIPINFPLFKCCASVGANASCHWVEGRGMQVPGLLQS